ncbi:hypothetical protein H845_1770 [Komagataeibacter xylinus E25]|nr:hypothetical protein H845_1770 [Komagataeibacter xylinus E25]
MTGSFFQKALQNAAFLKAAFLVHEGQHVPTVCAGMEYYFWMPRFFRSLRISGAG